MYNTIEERKSAFITLYHQNLDIIEIANALNVEVARFFDANSNVRGAIAFDKNKFSIVYNTFHAQNIIERIKIIAHEMAHWIFDYDQIKREPLFDDIGGDAQSEIEVRAQKFAEALLQGNISLIAELQ